MKSCFAGLIFLLTLHLPVHAQSVASDQVLANIAPAQNEVVLRHLGEGYTALRGNNLAAAESHFLAVRRLEPKNVWGALNLAVVLQRQSRFTEARSIYNEVLVLDNGKERAALASQATFSAASPSEIARSNLALLANASPVVGQKCSAPFSGLPMRLATDSAPDGCPASIADIRFVFNKALPTPEGRVVLKALPARLKQGSAVQVRGYTDDQGSGRLNRSLAAKRAAYVARWLNKHGIRVSSQSAHGLCCYLSPESSRQARQINRRVEIEF